jgi:type IV secretory pathway ATPase VirB11/archaellum biosynthesis ATPase
MLLKFTNQSPVGVNNGLTADVVNPMISVKTTVLNDRPNIVPAEKAIGIRERTEYLGMNLNNSMDPIITPTIVNG